MKYFMSILALLMLFYSAPAYGQSESIVAIRWGGNMTTISGLEVGGTSRTGIKIGISATIPIQERFSLLFGTDYVPKGVREHLHYGITELAIDYIEFSGLGNLTIFAPSRGPSLSILAGPTIAFKVRHEGEDPLGRRYGGREQFFEFKTVDFGLAGGIGTQIPFFDDQLAVKAELLYTLGIRAINTTRVYAIIQHYDTRTIEEKSLSMTNHAISFTVGLGYLF